MDDWKEVIENLKYLISEDCTDTQFDYADEIETAIRVMESQEDLRSKVDKAIAEIKELYIEWENSTDDARLESNPFGAVLNIIQRNIGE